MSVLRDHEQLAQLLADARRADLAYAEAEAAWKISSSALDEARSRMVKAGQAVQEHVSNMIRTAPIEPAVVEVDYQGLDGERTLYRFTL